MSVSGNWVRSTPWTINLVHVSCLLTVVISWSNFLTCSSIVVWYLLSSSSVNVPMVVRVRFPRLFHWIPAILKLGGAFCVVSYMLMVFLISKMSACSFFASTFLWMIMVRSERLGGAFSFWGLVFFATVAQVFPSVGGFCWLGVDVIGAVVFVVLGLRVVGAGVFSLPLCWVAAVGGSCLSVC